MQSDEQWDRFASLALIDEPEWATRDGRKRDEDALEGRIEQWTESQNVSTLEQILQNGGILAYRLVSI